MLEKLFYLLVFPGFLFSFATGGILSWVDRKITARLQFRKGPPLLQPFFDIGKLLNKETILPKQGDRITFLLAPLVSLFAAILAGVFILLPVFKFGQGFSGDILVTFYLVALPSIAYIIGAAATGNPLAMLGASREMKLILGYELTFLLVFAGIIYKSGMSIRFTEILHCQQMHGAFIGSLSGVILFIAGIFCVQAKLGLVPFDVAEAETEITHGMFIENSGASYALIKCTRNIMHFVLASLLVSLFLGGFSLAGFGILWSLLKLIFVVVLFTLIRNTNPRVRIDQAMRFFFIRLNVLVIIALMLSMFGF